MNNYQKRLQQIEEINTGIAKLQRRRLELQKGLVKYFTGLIEEHPQHGEGDPLVWIGGLILAQEIEHFHEQKQAVYCIYATNPTPITPEILIDLQIRSSEGVIAAQYEERFSEITGYLWTTETGEIGGHDMIAIFRSFVGLYGAIAISAQPIDLNTVWDW